MTVPADTQGEPSAQRADDADMARSDVPARRAPAAGEATEMLRQVVAAARAAVRADGAAILLYDRERDLFAPAIPAVALGLDERWLQRQGLEAAQSLAARVLAQREIAAVPDTSEMPELDFPLLAGGRRPASVHAVPLEVEGDVVGVLGLYDAAPRRSPIDHAALRAFGALAGLAIATARAHERERAGRARLEALDEASKALAAELSLDRVLRRIVEIATAISGARYGALGVLGDDGYLSDFITTGLSPEQRERIGPLPRGHGLLGVLIRLGRPVRIPDISRDPRRVGFPPNHPPMTSLLGVPIRVREEIVGDLYLADKVGAAAFSEEDQHLVERLAAHAGIAIENARLYAEVRRLALLHERDRIGRDLHDGIIQDIYAGTLQLDNLAEDVSDEALRSRLTGLAEHFSRIIGDVRSYIQGLRARELEGRPLGEGVAALVQEMGRRGELEVAFSLEGQTYRVPDALATSILQLAREALSNVVRHAGARRIHVRLSYEAQGITLQVADDGRGFDPASMQGEEHQGLRNLRARAAEVGGTLDIASRPGAGTTLRAFIPAPN